MDAIKGMIPGMGGDEESPEEKEKARKEAIRIVEVERKKKYKGLEDEREVRDKPFEISTILKKKLIQRMRHPKTKRKASVVPKKPEEDDDPAAQAKKLAEENLAKAEEMAAGKCSLQ